MIYDKENELIVTLAEILAGSQTTKENAKKALTLICNTFSFPVGLIYESNYFEQFCLVDHYADTTFAYKQNFFINEFTPQERLYLAKQSVLYTEKNVHNTPLETKLLNLYTADSIALAPAVDEKWHIYGLIVLLGTKNPKTLSAPETKTLSVSLSMLLHYVSLRMYQTRLNQTQHSFESILDNTGIDIYVNDFHTHDILYVNKSMAAPYGGQEHFIGQKCWQVLFPGQSGPCEFCPEHKLLDARGNPTKIYSWDYQRPFDGLWFRVFSAAFSWVDGRLAHVVSSADITDNKRNEALVEHLANFDQLTKLPNRRMLLKECDRRIDNSSSAEQGYMLFFDIDGFKAVNDTLGHDAGDELLIQLGEFFSGIPLLKSSIYRNGGDEFVAIVGGETITKAHIQSLAKFIHKRFNKPWRLKKGNIQCNTSIGVACYPEDGITAEQLLQKADMAMYHGKKLGGGRLCFASELAITQ